MKNKKEKSKKFLPKNCKGWRLSLSLESEKKNGEEYEPSSIRGFLQSVDRYFRRKGYEFLLLNDKEFCQLQDIPKKKQKQLNVIGKGNKPKHKKFTSDVLPSKTPRLYNRDLRYPDSGVRVRVNYR